MYVTVEGLQWNVWPQGSQPDGCVYTVTISASYSIASSRFKSFFFTMWNITNCKLLYKTKCNAGLSRLSSSLSYSVAKKKKPNKKNPITNKQTIKTNHPLEKGAKQSNLYHFCTFIIFENWFRRAHIFRTISLLAVMIYSLYTQFACLCHCLLLKEWPHW